MKGPGGRGDGAGDSSTSLLYSGPFAGEGEPPDTFWAAEIEARQANAAHAYAAHHGLSAVAYVTDA